MAAKAGTSQQSITKAKTRIGWVDAAKGFAMLSIILGHFCAFFMSDLEFAKSLFIVTGTFHVPLFFLLSGYTMRCGWMGKMGVAKLAKRCFLPYVFAGIASVIMCLVFVDPSRMYDFVFGFFYGAGAYRDHILFGDTSQVNAIGLVWFLPALFVGKLLALAISEWSTSQKFVFSGCAFVLAAVSAPVLFLPFDIQQGMCACWFITLGSYLKETNAFGDEKMTARAIGAGGNEMQVAVPMMAVVGCVYVCACLTGSMSIPMYCNSTYHQPLVDMLACSGVCIAAIIAVKFVTERVLPIERIFTWCGINSIAIFAFHAITLAPGDHVKWWIHDMLTAGTEPVWAFFATMLVNVAIVFIATVISRHVRPLRWILYGTAVPAMPPVPDGLRSRPSRTAYADKAWARQA